MRFHLRNLPHLYRDAVIIGAALLAAVAPRAYAEQPSVLSSAVIVGSTVYPAPRLFSVYGSRLGRPLTPAQAAAVTTELTSLYVRDGYSQPQLQVDERLLAAGILRIQVFEPRFTRVAFTGDAGPYAARLQALGERVRASVPVRPAEVQSALQAMRALPGLSIDLATAQDEVVRNGFVLTVKSSFRTTDGLVRVSNRGSHEIGPVFVDGQIVTNGLLGHQEKLGLIFTAATQFAEYHAVGALADLPVSDRGAHVSVLGFQSWSEPDQNPSLDDSYRRSLGVLRFVQPLWSSGASSLSVSGGLDVDNQTTDREGATLRDDRLRVADLTAQSVWSAGSTSQYAASLEVRQGLRGLGAGLMAADLVPDLRRDDFLISRIRLSQLTALGTRWSLRLDAVAQFSGYVLPYSEQLKIGGEVLGRGFEVTQVSGDKGVDARAELRRDLAVPMTFGNIAFYSYYDYGVVTNQDGSGSDCAAVAGAGLSLLKGAWTGYAEITQPLIHPDVDGSRSPRIFVEIAARF